MEDLRASISQTSVADMVKRARDQNYVKRLTKQQEKVSKDIGGILVPSAFQVPNEIIDDGWLKELGGAEVKVLLYIIRKTFGYNKIAGDQIPLSQIIGGTGLSRQSALSSIAVLEACELIRVVRGKSADGSKNVNFYKLITRHDYNKTK
jgi:hypothetical protein